MLYSLARSPRAHRSKKPRPRSPSPPSGGVATRRADTRLQEYAVEAKSAVEWAQRRVRTAAVAALATSPLVVETLERVEQLQRELIAVGDALLWLTDRHVIALNDRASYDVDTELANRARQGSAAV